MYIQQNIITFLICLCVYMYGPAYASQQFSNFLGSWKTSYTTGKPYNPQAQAIVERPTELSRSYWPGLSCQRLGEISPVYKHWASLPRNTPLPLVRWRDPISLQWQPPTPLTRGRGYACVFSSDCHNRSLSHSLHCPLKTQFFLSLLVDYELLEIRGLLVSVSLQQPAYKIYSMFIG